MTAGPILSQEAPASQTGTTTLHVASRLVVIDVAVLDRNGKFVSNLDRSQFTVTEDKVRQTILLKVKAADLTWEPQPDGTRRAEVTVVAVGYSNGDKEVGQHAAQLKQEIGPNDVIGSQSQVGFTFPFAMPP